MTRIYGLSIRVALLLFASLFYACNRLRYRAGLGSRPRRAFRYVYDRLPRWFAAQADDAGAADDAAADDAGPADDAGSVVCFQDVLVWLRFGPVA